MSLHVSSTCAHRQEVRIVLYRLWYHHTETSELCKITKITTIIKKKKTDKQVQSTTVLLEMQNT